MKTRKKGFIWSVVLFVFSTILILQLGILESPEKAPEEFLILFLSLQVFSVILLIVNPFKKSQPNYNWEEIADGNCFKILYIYEYSEGPEGESRKMIVDVDFFGETLMFFPKNINLWNNQDPEVKGKYIKYGNRLLKVFN